MRSQLLLALTGSLPVDLLMSATRTTPLHLRRMGRTVPMLLVTLVLGLELVVVVVGRVRIHLQMLLHLMWRVLRVLGLVHRQRLPHLVRLVLRAKALVLLVMVLVLVLALVLLTADHKNRYEILEVLCVYDQLALGTNPPPTLGAV